MKLFTHIFIYRPVLATVISLLILLFGLRAIDKLQLRQYPEVKNTQITVTTSYPGASAALVAGFITDPIQRAVASADGIDYLVSTTSDGVSVINANIKLNFDPDKAFTNIMSKVSEVKNVLPTESQAPVIQKSTGESVALMYLSYTSNTMNAEQITDYVSRVVQPKLETIQGVAGAEILGASVFAMRVWLDPYKLAAFHVTPADVSAALQNNNFQAAVGSTKGEYIAISINANTDLHDVTAFQKLVVKNEGDTLIHLEDVAKVELGSQSYDFSVSFNGEKAIFVAINQTPSANPLSVISDVYKVLPSITRAFPPGLSQKVVYDATKYIRASIKEVIKTIVEAALIVILIILLFLGSFRTTLIPVVTIPLSLVGACSLMLALGYSINLLTLLAMVLAIGLVVDDAIVVVENIYRHIEEGMEPLKAALRGASEIVLPVISMTITLAAVYAPIGFMTGLTGALFTEFAFTLASAVILSGIIALTLSPMLCSKLLTSDLDKNRYVHFINAKFDGLRILYQRRLTGVLLFRPVVLVFSAVVLVSCYFLYITTQEQMAPAEDKGVLFMISSAQENANINYIQSYNSQYESIFKTLPGLEDYFIVNGMNGPNSGFSGLILKPWSERKESIITLQMLAQDKVNEVAGLETFIIPLPPLPTSGGMMPIEFVLTSLGDFKELYEIAEKIVLSAKQSGLFMMIQSDLKYNKPQIDLNFNREKAAQMGIQMEDIAAQLSTSLSGGYINRFSLNSRSYEVIPQLLRQYRLNQEDLNNIYINTQSGKLVPLSTIATLTRSVQPNQLSQFQQLNAVTITGMAKPGQTVTKGLDFLRTEANQYLTNGMSYDYGGQSRQLMQEGSSLMITFFFSLIIIYLVLAAQFESFRDPLIVMVSVPMSICGALIPLNILQGIVDVSINIYTQIGLITLIGLISKHGILMVDFANHLQKEENLSLQEAILKAAGIRLRPILMTTAAMVVGVVPLLLAQGPGASSRFNIGLVIASGMAIGTLFTLFVLPTLYTYLAEDKIV